MLVVVVGVAVHLLGVVGGQQLLNVNVLVGISQVFVTMRVRTILAELAHALLLEVLASLSLVIIVRNVQHLHLHIDW